MIFPSLFVGVTCETNPNYKSPRVGVEMLYTQNLRSIQINQGVKLLVRNHDRFKTKILTQIRLSNILLIESKYSGDFSDLMFFESPSLFLAYRQKGLFFKKQFGWLFFGLQYKTKKFRLKYLVNSQNLKEHQLKVKLVAHRESNQKMYFAIFVIGRKFLTPNNINVIYNSDAAEYNHVFIGEQLKVKKGFSVIYGFAIGFRSVGIPRQIASVSDSDSNSSRISWQNLSPLFASGIHLMIGVSYQGHRIYLPFYFLENTDQSSWKFTLFSLGLYLCSKVIVFGYEVLRSSFKKEKNNISSKDNFVKSTIDNLQTQKKLENKLKKLPDHNRGVTKYLVFRG